MMLGITSVVSAKAEANPSVGASLIYEIRGGDPYRPGSINIFEQLLSQNTTSQARGIYAVRYDALRDSSYEALMIGYSTARYDDAFGILAEVTTQLLTDAHVEGVRDMAQDHMRTLAAYSPSDRKKILDTLLSQYHDVFGKYPLFASSRIIDSSSAQYLKDTYGIRYQYIDPEDQDIDGGPPQYPYPASKNWLLIPDYTNPDPVWVIRKRTIDPLCGYGSAEETNISSQEYIALLKNALLDQPAGQRGFAGVNLTNTDPKDLLRNADVIKYFSTSTVSTLYPSDIPALFSDPISVYTRTLDDRTAWFITTPQYRYRIIADKQSLWITDIRVYDTSLTDPYDTAIAQDGIHWVAPFLINGARWYEDHSPDDIFLHSKNDFGHAVTSLKMPDRLLENLGRTKTLKSDGSISIQYFSPTRREVLAVFAEKNLSLFGFESNEKKLAYNQYAPSTFPVVETRDSMSWIWKDKNLYSMTINCRSIGCDMDFHADQIGIFNTSRFEHYPYTFPEQRGRVVDEKKSTIPTHLYAIQDKAVYAPIRMRDSFGLDITKSAKTTPVDLQTQIISPDVGNRPFAVEYLGGHGKTTLKGVLTTVPNCPKDWSKCFTRPTYLISYLFPIMGTYLLR